MEWYSYPENKPEPMGEVLVLVNSHRGPSWRNNYCVVAYLDLDNKWYEERHGNEVEGVIAYTFIEYP